MDRIKSFQINHNILEPGFYISREDGDIITYDLRTRKPNAGDYMSNSAMHSVEHMYISDLWDVRRDFILWSDRLSRKRYLM